MNLSMIVDLNGVARKSLDECNSLKWMESKYVWLVLVASAQIEKYEILEVFHN